MGRVRRDPSIRRIRMSMRWRELSENLSDLLRWRPKRNLVPVDEKVAVDKRPIGWRSHFWCAAERSQTIYALWRPSRAWALSAGHRRQARLAARDRSRTKAA